MLGEAGTSVTANLFWEALSRATMLVPKSLDTLAADPKTFANLTGAFTALARGDNPLSQVLAQGAHMCFLMPKTTTNHPMRLSK